MISILNLVSLLQHCGFITFDKPESAERAIVELNGTSVDGVDLKVNIRNFKPRLNIFILIWQTSVRTMLHNQLLEDN